MVESILYKFTPLDLTKCQENVNFKFTGFKWKKPHHKSDLFSKAYLLSLNHILHDILLLIYGLTLTSSSSYIIGLNLFHYLPPQSSQYVSVSYKSNVKRNCVWTKIIIMKLQLPCTCRKDVIHRQDWEPSTDNLQCISKNHTIFLDILSYINH